MRELIEWVAFWLSTMTAEEALAEGLTHHGRFCGVSVWMNDSGLVTAKWNLLNLLIPFLAKAQIFLFVFFNPGAEPCFQFLKGPKIEVEE